MNDRELDIYNTGMWLAAILLLVLILACTKCNSDAQAANAAQYNSGWHYDQNGRWVAPNEPRREQ